MRDLTGKKVLMKTANARWYLDNPEIYTDGTTWDDAYEPETLVHFACCLGVPIYGKVLRRGSDCYLVRFKFGKTTACYFLDRNKFTVL